MSLDRRDLLQEEDDWPAKHRGDGTRGSGVAWYSHLIVSTKKTWKGRTQALYSSDEEQV